MVILLNGMRRFLLEQGDSQRDTRKDQLFCLKRHFIHVDKKHKKIKIIVEIAEYLLAERVNCISTAGFNIFDVRISDITEP